MPSQPPSSETGDKDPVGAGVAPSGNSAHCTEPTPAEAFADARRKFLELGEYFSYYLAAKADIFRLALRRRLIRAWVMAVVMLAAAGMVVTAIVLICDGICDGLSLLFSHRWIGELVTGVLVLAVVVTAGWIGLRQLFALSHARTTAKYENRRQRQKADFRHDVAQRADERSGNA